MKNYALITKGIEDLLIESFESKDKKIINELLTELKSNPKLKTLYAVVDNLKNGIIPTKEIDAFINENIKIAKAIDFSEFDKLLSRLNGDEPSELLENIGVLLFKSKNAMNISEHYRASAYVKNHLIDLNTWEEDYKVKLSEYSEQFSDLEGDDKILFEQFFISDAEGRKNLFETLVTDCSSLLTEHIKSIDSIETKISLYETKDTISTFVYDSSTYAEKMVRLHELKKDLLKII